MFSYKFISSMSKVIIFSTMLILIPCFNIYSFQKPYHSSDFPNTYNNNDVDETISQIISELDDNNKEENLSSIDSEYLQIQEANQYNNQKTHHQQQNLNTQQHLPPPIRLSQKVVMIGISPFQSPKGMLYQFTTLLSALKSDMGVKKVRLVTANDYKGVVNALLNGTIDFAWVGVGTYILGNKDKQLIPVVQTIRNKSNNYFGVFITLKDSKILGLEDIIGKRLGFVDIESTSGFIYPFYYLLQAKIDPFKQCKEVKFLKRHDLVIQAIIDKKIDVGVCLEETYKTFISNNPNSNLMILGKTPPIPSDIIICRSDCHPTLIEKFKNAIIKYKSNQNVLSTYISSLEFKEINQNDLLYAEKIVEKVIKSLPNYILQTLNKK